MKKILSNLFLIKIFFYIIKSTAKFRDEKNKLNDKLENQMYLRKKIFKLRFDIDQNHLVKKLKKFNFYKFHNM